MKKYLTAHKFFIYGTRKLQFFIVQPKQSTFVSLEYDRLTQLLESVSPIQISLPNP
jgi:hypothetical protein